MKGTDLNVKPFPREWKFNLRGNYSVSELLLLGCCLVLSVPRNITGQPGVSIMWLGGVARGPMTCYPSEAAL